MNTTVLIPKFVEIWNERDAAARETLMKSSSPTTRSTPIPDYAGLRGHAELSKAIGRAHATLGGLHFTLGAMIGVHHDRALFTWQLGTVATGYDVVEFDGGVKPAALRGWASFRGHWAGPALRLRGARWP